MRTLYNYSNYGNDLKLTYSDAQSVALSGDMENNVIELMEKKYVKRQLDLINPKQLAKELNDYGAWDDDELKNHKENLKRWVWLSGCDIVENK